MVARCRHSRATYGAAVRRVPRSKVGGGGNYGCGKKREQQSAAWGLFADLGQRGLQKFVCEKEAVLPERFDKRPGGRDEAALLGAQDDAEGAGLRQSEGLGAAPRLEVVDDDLGAGPGESNGQDVSFTGAEIPTGDLAW
jgi:hypothetical protein